MLRRLLELLGRRVVEGRRALETLFRAQGSPL
jgi:hypothetical protein